MIKRIIYYLQYKRTIRDSYWLKKLKWYGIPLQEVSWSKETKSPILVLFGIELTSKKLVFVLEGYQYLISLNKHLNLQIAVHSKSELKISFDSFQFIVDSKQELLILDEVFVKTCYGYQPKDDAILIDIGFNVGITSLYFAQFENIKKIYAYEPFEPTLQKGLSNLDLNPALTKKISTFNYGLAEFGKSMEILYDYDKKGSISTEHNYKRIKGNRKLKITLKPAHLAVAELIRENPQYKFICKMDCEGSEYGIIRNLNKYSFLQKIKVFMIEYHFEGPDEIINILSEMGFQSFIIKNSPEIGMIYSVNCNL